MKEFVASNDKLDEEEDSDSFLSFSNGVRAFPGCIPHRFETIQDYKTYFTNMILYEKFFEERDKQSRIFTCIDLKCFSMDLTAKKCPQNRFVRLIVKIHGLHFFRVNDKLIVRVPA